MNAQLELPKALQKSYRLKDWPGNGTRQDFGKFGIIDLKILTDKQASRLVRMKFPYLEELSDKSSSATSTNK